MKKIIMLIVAIILAAVGLTLAAASSQSDTELRLQINNSVMSVNGKSITLDAPPVIVNNRTLVPLRAVIENMGGNVEWNNASRTAVLAYGGNNIRLTIDSTAAYLNNEEKTLDVAPQIINGRTMLPIRFIAEGFGFAAVWEQETQSIVIAKSASDSQNSAADTSQPTAQAQTTVPSSGGKTLVAYFTWSGNTKQMAEYIANKTNADIFVIEPETPYPTDYSKCGEVAKTERDENARPKIKNLPNNLDEYDTIYVGYPICDCVKLGLKNI